MEIDHIFIFSDKKGEEANSLVEFGLKEGSSRIHPGQGTINRKFYFRNFFLEILWVVDEKEIKSKLTSKTKLWERSQFMTNGTSPFGLCLINSKSTDKLFQDCETYQPSYFPQGMSIEMITNEHYPNLPWTFRLPYRNGKRAHIEPIDHPNGIKLLTRTEFELEMFDYNGEYGNFFKDSKNVELKDGNRTHLILEFDKQRQGKSKKFSDLNLTINY